MMRALIGLLLLANVAYWAWTQGWLGEGAAAGSQREPERLARQVRPESIRILAPTLAAGKAAGKTPGTPPRAAAALDAAGACLQAGPFASIDIGPAEAALKQAVPELDGLRFSRFWADAPGLWVVYMGKYASREARLKKQEELRRYRVGFEDLEEPPALAPGLILGRFDSRSEADAFAARLVQRGLSTPRVVALVPAVSGHVLRVERADAAVQSQLLALADPALQGHGFVPCPTPPVLGPIAAASAAASGTGPAATSQP